MLRIWNDEIVKILSQGVSLENSGTKNWGLTRAQALDALERLKNINVPVSGGDVYRFVDGKFIPTYDNWYFEDLEGPDSVENSIKRAKDFIERYQALDNPLFALVPHLNVT